MGLELQLERLSLFQGYKGNLPYTYSIFFYIKYLICLKFILVSDIVPKCTVHIIQSKIIPILKLIKKFTTSMLHILAIASFYFHSGQFLQSVWSTYLHGIQKNPLFLCLWFGLGGKCGERYSRNKTLPVYPSRFSSG